ncbi:MAG: hypothetical protein HYR85_22970 [Planctomycetes bacterium]|nr:hypothetical protein [Planctomycetota bacterium]MBI3843350.1 hypothetical protein [Planctomycetota bacterium]
MTGSVYPSKDFVDLQTKMVGIAQHSGRDHGDEEVTVNGEKKRLCNDFFTITCDVHENMGGQLAKYGIGQGVKAVPTHVIILPDKTEVFRYVGAMGVKQIKDHIEEAQKRLGKGMSHAEWVKARDGLDKAQKDFEAGSTHAAIDGLKWVDGAKNQTPLVERAKKLLDEIDAKGAEQLTTAKTLADAGNADEASKALNAIAKDYAGRPVEKDARKILSSLKTTKN